jgi:hypothetical protein
MSQEILWRDQPDPHYRTTCIKVLGRIIGIRIEVGGGRQRDGESWAAETTVTVLNDQLKWNSLSAWWTILPVNQQSWPAVFDSLEQEAVRRAVAVIDVALGAR